jgi:hypothetical protein
VAASKLTSTGVQASQLTADPSSPTPVAGQQYFNTVSKVLRVFNGVAWRNVSDAPGAFLTRQIITHGFVMGGYKSSTPWTNVNTMVHATDVMTNNGNILTAAGAYVSGACSLTNGHMFGCDANIATGTTVTASMNMYTMTGFVGPSMTTAHNDSAVMHKEHEFAWIVGGLTDVVDVLNLSNDTMYASQGISTSNQSAGTGNGAHSGELAARVWSDSADAMFTFATGTAVTITTAVDAGWHGQQKGISSKIGKGWAGNEGSYNLGYNLRVYSYDTGTMLSTVAKPVGNSGEENFDMGQAHQYMMGMYDGVQNNRGWKFYYSTQTGSELSTGSVRTGVAGGSSGACVWRG